MPELELNLRPSVDELLKPYLGDVRNLTAVRDTLKIPAATAQRSTPASGTGPQASMRARVASTVSAVLPLLAGLKPVKKDCCDAEPARNRVRATLEELAAAFQTKFVVPQRVDTVFQQLIGSTTKRSLLHPLAVKGHLGKLRDAFGLRNNECGASVPYAEQLTTFRLIVEYADMLRLSWYALRDDPDGDAGEAIGSVLETMQALNESFNQSLQELQTALMAAGVTAADQMTTTINGVPLTNVLGWLADLAAQQIDDDEGIDSVLAQLTSAYPFVQAFAPDDNDEQPRIRAFTRRFFANGQTMKENAAACCEEHDAPVPIEIHDDDFGVPEAFCTPHVRHAAEKLRRTMAATIGVAQQVTLQPAAILTSACFSLAAAEEEFAVHTLYAVAHAVSIKVQGTALDQVRSAYLAPSGQPFNAEQSLAIDIEKQSPECIAGTFSPEKAEPGTYDVVAREDSGATAVLPRAATIASRTVLHAWNKK